jgi:hypothetical protein
MRSEGLAMTDLKAWLRERAEKDDLLYERYGKPLEADHTGEYVAISDDGEIILGTDSLGVDLKALERFGSGRYCFRRIGYDVEGVWLRTV